MEQRERKRKSAFQLKRKIFPFSDKRFHKRKVLLIPDYNQGPKGTDTDTSEAWYYNTPTDINNMPIHSFTYFDSEVEGKLKSGENGTRTQHNLTDNEWKNVVQNFNTVRYLFRTFNYAYNVKWITYKIYRVDPLTRENISESAVFGEDKPVQAATFSRAVYSLQSLVSIISRVKCTE